MEKGSGVFVSVRVGEFEAVGLMVRVGKINGVLVLLGITGFEIVWLEIVSWLGKDEEVVVTAGFVAHAESERMIRRIKFCQTMGFCIFLPRLCSNKTHLPALLQLGL